MRKFLLYMIFLMLGGSASLFAQDKTISGTISDENGNRIPFATIKVKGSNKGVSSDESGAFSISLSADQKDLEISAVGFAKQSVKVTDKKIGRAHV